MPAHSAAWAIGMIVAFAGLNTASDDASALAIVGTAAAVGIAVGATVASLTELALLWPLKGQPGASTA